MNMIDEIKKLARDKAREILEARAAERLAQEQAESIYYEEERGMLADLVRSLIPIRPFPESLLFIHETSFQEWIRSACDRACTVYAGLKFPNGNMVVAKFSGLGDGWKRQNDYWEAICVRGGVKTAVCNQEFWLALDTAANG